MHRAWWDHMVGLSSSGPAGVPLAILPFLWSPCQSSTYLLPQNSGWLLTRFILSVPSRYSAAFLCEDEGRLIPVLFCNAQEHLIARRQKSLAREGSSQASLVGKGADAVVTSGRQAALSRCEQPWHPSPSVLNSTQASQLNITRLLHRSPQYICAPPTPSALEQTLLQWLLLFIGLMCTEQSPGQEWLCSGFCVCWFVTLSWM